MAKIAGAGNGGALAPGSNGATGAPSARPRGSGRNAVLVAAGIALSRGIGLVRERIFSHYFGLSDAGDAFKAAFRIPNLLQNLFGEGVLSASFIPVYANLLAREDEEEAGRVAAATAVRENAALAAQYASRPAHESPSATCALRHTSWHGTRVRSGSDAGCVR